MAFVSSPPISKALRTNSSCVLPTQRREYRNAVAKKRRSPVRCEMGENRTSETSSLLSESSRKESRDESTPSLDLEIEDGVSVADANEDASDSEEPAPGIIQKTTDLDGRVLFGEFLSTFLFVYLSVNAASSGSAVANSLNNAAVIAAVAASFMPVSGAHLNPAVTLSLAITKRVSLRRGIAFIPIQLLASAAACYLAAMLGTPMSFSGIAASATTTDLVRAFFAELMPMFIIVIILYQTAVATEREGGVGNKLAALYIGLAVLACAGTFSGVFNPARAFGPALVTWNFANHWIYWIGPFVGACAAALISEHLFLAPASNRSPQGWLAELQRQSSSLSSRIKNLGVAGLFAYGVMNTIYYGAAFSVMMCKVGWSSGAGGLAQAWLVTWSLSQVTKPIRLGLSIAFAPVIDRFLTRRKNRKKES